MSRPGLALGPLQLEGLDLVVFDKDGTLIDFEAMWGAWAEDLAERLEATLGSPIKGELHREIGYDSLARRTIAGSPLAATPMAELRTMTTELVARSTGRSFGGGRSRRGRCLADPRPGRPGLPAGRPRERSSAHFADGGRQVAIVTSDDRAPTEATVASLGLAGLVDVIVCADDGLRSKPAPDTLLHTPAGPWASIRSGPRWSVTRSRTCEWPRRRASGGGSRSFPDRAAGRARTDLRHRDRVDRRAAPEQRGRQEHS